MYLLMRIERRNINIMLAQCIARLVLLPSFQCFLFLNKQPLELAISTPCHPAMNTLSFNAEKCKGSLNIKHYFFVVGLCFPKLLGFPFYLMIHTNQPTEEQFWNNNERFTPKQIKARKQNNRTGKPPLLCSNVQTVLSSLL